MAELLERYLLDKLAKDIEETGAADQKIVANIVPLEAQFLKLKDLLNDEAHFPIGSIRRRETLYHLNNLLSEWKLISKNQNSFPFVPQALAYNDLSRRLKTVKRELRQAANAGSTIAADEVDLDRQEVNGGTSLLRSSEYAYKWSSSFAPSKVHGFEEKVNYMEKQILESDSEKMLFKAIGVLGMEGIGKTTLCQQVFNRPKVKEYFYPRIWVCLSRQPNEVNDNRKEIMKRILRCLKVEEDIIIAAEEISNLLGLIYALHLQLIGKRYLIVLDDAFKNDKFYENLGSLGSNDSKWEEQLAFGFPKGCGGTVIVTTRDEQLAKKMVGPKNLSFLRPFSDPESCWLIFKDAVVGKDENEFPLVLEELKDKIVNKCAGVPMAAKMIGRIVHEQNFKESADKNEK